MDWPGWIVPTEAHARKHLFAQDAQGRRVFMPHGAGNLLLRKAYLVPSAEAEASILATYRRWAAYAHVVGFAGMLIALSAVFLMPGAVLREWGPAILLAMFVGIVGPQVAFPRVVVRLSQPLEDIGSRDFAAAVSFHGSGRRSAITGWTLSALVLFLCYGQLQFTYELLREGRFGIAIFSVGIAVFILPILGVGPAVAKLRRQRAENERLEAIVQERTAELEELNRTLEARAEEQVREIEKLGQLKHFFAAPVAEVILRDSGYDPTRVHRRELTVICVDLRGFTAFSETAEPEEVIAVLRVYHAELGILVNRHEATLEHFAGDGALIFLNDPVEVPDHPGRGLRLATELRAAMRPHIEAWRRDGFDLGMGAGVAMGHATIGAIGYEGRWEYAAIGNVCNLAARLCSEAKDGQVVTTQRVAARAGPGVTLAQLGEITLKGFTRPIAAFDVVQAAMP